MFVARLIPFALVAALLLPAPALAGIEELQFDIDGYYRARYHLFVNLFDKEFPKDGARDVTVWAMQDPSTQIPPDYAEAWRQRNPTATTSALVHDYCRQFQATTCRRAVKNPHLSSWFVQRGRFEPIVRFRGIKAQATIDVLDNVVWGDNENLANTPLFAGNPSTTGVDGVVSDSIAVKRLWVEWSTAFGLLRIGRQPSNWGLGLLAGDGDGFDNDFGDAYHGTVYDRIIFATRPVSLVKGIAAIATGKEMPKAEDDPGIIVAIGFDKLVESSAVPFRKELSDDDTVRDENDPDTGGIRRSAIWLSDRGDDVYEWIFVLMFQRHDWDVGGRLMDLTLGTYWVNRQQAETDSNVWIGDFYLDWRLMGIFAQFEIYHIFGSTTAIAPAWDKTTTAGITGLVGRVGYERGPFKGLVEVGHASGDDVILDEQFTGRALHADHNVGLILYEQVLAQRTVESFVGDPDLQGLWSKGGVYNSTYLNPRFTLTPGDIFEFRLGFLFAWADQVDGAIVPYLEGEGIGNITESKFLGAEVDFGAHMKWADGHILTGVEVGYMHAGDRLGRTSKYADPSTSAVALRYNAEQYAQIQSRLNNLFTAQVRFAFVF